MDERELYGRVKVGDIILLHFSAYAYNSAGAYGREYRSPRDPLIGGSQAYQLPRIPYVVIELRCGLMALVTSSGIAWVPAAYLQEIL